MPHCTFGKSAVTAAASRCAVECRYTSSASGILVGHDPDLRVLRQRIREVDHLVVDEGGDRGVGKARRDRFGDRLHRRAGRDLLSSSRPGSVTVT